MPIENSQIKHYVEALVALGLAVEELSKIEKDLDVALDLLQNNEEIRRFIANTYVKSEGKLRAFEEILDGRLHPIVVHFILIMQDHDHLSAIDRVAALFTKKVAMLTKRICGRVTTARPLTSEKLVLLEKEVSILMGSDIQLQVTVDPNMLGGVFVRVGDFVLDGTVEHRLESIRKNLLS